MITRIVRTFLIVCAATCVVGVGAATATTLTFDDIGTGGSIPNGYGGLNWSSVHYLNGTTYPLSPSGYYNGRVSGDYVAWNGSGGDVLSNTAAGTFDFNSTYLTAAWNNGLNIQVRGYNNGILLYDQTVIVDQFGPTLFVFNYLGIDDLKFTTFGGVDAGTPGSGQQMAMDNFTFNQSAQVPEPASLLLLGTGVAAVMRRRRKSRA